MEPAAYPAVRGKIGDWTYYVTAMTMGELALRVKFAYQLYEPTSLNSVIQRDLTNRSSEIAAYLMRQPQRFFGSMIIAVADGEPQFTSVRIVDPKVPSSDISNLGLLAFDGSQKYFALDGQHRLMGIREAVAKKPKLSEEQVSVIFVQHKHDDHPKLGWSRTRRLFTTLNRYAKPISKKDAIVMDEDDAVAIVTRTLVQEFQLFRGGRLLLSQGKSLHPKNKEAFTNIITVYDVNETVLKAQWPKISKAFKQSQRPVDEVESMYQTVEKFWVNVSKSIAPIEELVLNPNLPIAENLRSRDGGHLLFRPIGMTTLAEAFRLAILSGISSKVIFERLAKVDYDMTRSPWNGIVWHSGSQKMLAKSENGKLASRLLAYLIHAKLDKNELLEEYRAVLSTSGKRYKGKLPPQVK